MELVDGGLAGVAPHRGEELGLHPRPPSDDVAGAEEILRAVEIGDPASGLTDEENDGRDVPGGEAELEEAVVDPGGGIGEVERRGAAAADGLDAEERLAEGGEVEIEGRMGAEGIAGGEERPLEPAQCRNPHRPTIPGRPGARRGGEDVFPLRVVDHPGEELAPPPAGDRNAVDRQPLEEVGGAVERIDDPFTAAAPAGARPALLGEDPVVGMAGENGADDRLLALLVGPGDEVVLALLADIEVPAPEVAGDDRGPGGGGGECSFE